MRLLWRIVNCAPYWSIIDGTLDLDLDTLFDERNGTLSKWSLQEVREAHRFSADFYLTSAHVVLIFLLIIAARKHRIEYKLVDQGIIHMNESCRITQRMCEVVNPIHHSYQL